MEVIMTFGQAIKNGFQNYTSWKGRASRSEFWYWTLFVWLVELPFSIWYQTSVNMTDGSLHLFTPAYFVLILVALVVFLPSLAVMVRRLHDTDRSGGFYWMGLIPLVGWIFILVYMLQPSKPGANRFES
jgi:uncharacterized membrane protein YhaH (DUF805 family)